jgi:hypothetical protein
MNKPLLIVLTFVAAIGGLVFYDQVLALFAGMTPLAALKLITDYVLHVAIVTILGMVIFGLPEIVKPWLGLLRRKRRALRRGAPMRTEPVQRAPRINKDQVLMWLASRMTQTTKTPTPSQTPPADDVQFKL